MIDSNGVSTRMSTVIAAVMPKIAVTVANRTSTATPRIDLATAENWLVRDELVTLFMEAVAKDLDHRTLSYPQGFGGDPALLSALASFFNTYFRSAIPVRPSHIAVVGGASSCLDQLIYTICDAGDSVLVPAPYWNGFDFHLTLRTGVTILPVSTPTLRSTVSASLIPALDTAYNTARDPARIKALLFTNPHNPLGQCYKKAVIREAICWCGRKGIHFVGNEVYGLSEFRRGKEDEAFVSTLSLVARKGDGKCEEKKSDAGDPAGSSNNSHEIGRSDAHGMTPAAGSGENRQELQDINGHVMEKDIDLSRVHTIWSMSKDLGCSGLRIATLVSQNNSPLLTSIRFLAAPLLTSPTTLLATALFSSEKLHAIIKLSRVRLARAYAIVEAQLKRWGVDFVEARAGVFVWARLLSASTVGATTGADKVKGRVVEHGNLDGEVDGHAGPAVGDWEAQLMQRIHDCGVVVSPGQAYHVGASLENKGWVRITFAIEEGQLREGLRKIGECLGLGKKRRAVGKDQTEGEEASQVREESSVDTEDQRGGEGMSQVEKGGMGSQVEKDGKAETE